MYTPTTAIVTTVSPSARPTRRRSTEVPVSSGLFCVGTNRNNAIANGDANAKPAHPPKTAMMASSAKTPSASLDDVAPSAERSASSLR